MGPFVIPVLKTIPTITWSRPANITYGTALSSIQLDATATFNGNMVPGTFAYTTESETPVTTRTVWGAGTYILTATFTQMILTMFKVEH
jgi:hypothetical protein